MATVDSLSGRGGTQGVESNWGTGRSSPSSRIITSPFMAAVLLVASSRRCQRGTGPEEGTSRRTVAAQPTAAPVSALKASMRSSQAATRGAQPSQKSWLRRRSKSAIDTPCCSTQVK